MANYQDAYISDIIVTLAPSADRPTENIIADLKQMGMQIDDSQCTQTVIEGAVDAGKVGAIDNLPGVDYVRTVFTYVADYPPGDPRDLDLVGREGDE